jgi:tetraprenyl-beta-curcumene synthase
VRPAAHGAWRAFAIRDVLTLLWTGARYWSAVAPLARRELRRWDRLAAEIPDPILRELALQKLREERLSAEGAALFATLAPRRYRPAVVRLTVAYEILFDLLDGLGEVPSCDPFENNLQLHSALLTALDPGQHAHDYLRFHPPRRDGGYVASLVAACRRAFQVLPSARTVLPTALQAAQRCRRGQSLLHSRSPDSVAPLVTWATSLGTEAAGAFVPFELAAATISPLALHALFAAAADPTTTAPEAIAVDRAYFPAVCALTILFDGLVDAPKDRGTDNHSFLSHYPDDEAAGDRLAQIAEHSQQLVRRLPHGRRHTVLVAGIIAFYLSVSSVGNPPAKATGAKVLEHAHPFTAPMAAVLRARRDHAG